MRELKSKELEMISGGLIGILGVPAALGVTISLVVPFL